MSNGPFKKINQYNLIFYIFLDSIIQVRFFFSQLYHFDYVVVYLFYYCILSNSLCIYSVIFQKVFFSFTLIIIIIIIMEFQLFICVGSFSHNCLILIMLWFIYLFYFFILSVFLKNVLIFSLFILLLLSLLLLFSYWCVGRVILRC